MQMTDVDAEFIVNSLQILVVKINFPHGNLKINLW